MKTIISLFMLSVLSYGSVKAQSEDRYSNAIKKEITQTNAGPTLVEIKDGDVTVNGEVVANISDKSECLRLKINTECMKPKPKPVATCDPCQRRRSCGSCGSRCGSSNRYGYSRYESSSYGGYYSSHSYGGYNRSSSGNCGCRHHHDEW